MIESQTEMIPPHGEGAAHSQDAHTGANAAAAMFAATRTDDRTDELQPPLLNRETHAKREEERETAITEEEALALYPLDVQEAATLLGVSLARLSQLTSKGTLSHVRRRVGARWRLFYRRDEIDEMVRGHRMTLSTRIPVSLKAGYVYDRTTGDELTLQFEPARTSISPNAPAPLHTERHVEAQGTTTNGGDRPSPPPGESGADFPRTVSFHVPNLRASKEKHLGYGTHLPPASTLENDRLAKADQAVRDSLQQDVITALADLAVRIDAIALAQKNLAPHAPRAMPISMTARDCLERAGASGNSVIAAERSLENGSKDTTAQHSPWSRGNKKRDSLRAPRVHFQK